MQKKYAIGISVSIAAILLIIAIVAMILFVPLQGKENTLTWSKSDDFDMEKDVATIDIASGKECKILQLSDLQLWMDAKDNAEALAVAQRLIEKEKPDLVVVAGDSVSGITAPYLLKDFIQFMEEQAVAHNFYWAPVFGNHDNEIKATPNWSADRYEEASVANGGRCLFRKGPNNLGGTIGNYVVNIRQDGKIIQSVYMMDASSYMEYPQDIVDYTGRGNSEKYITYQQIDWFAWNASNIAKEAGGTVPSMVVTHFAQYESMLAFKQMVAGADGIYGNEDDMKPDANGRYAVPEELGFGKFGYMPGVAQIQTGFIDCAKAYGLHTALYGHDHESDAVIRYEGVNYVYGLKTGPSPKPWNNTEYFGGTVIEFNADSASQPNIRHIIDQKAADYWENK